MRAKCSLKALADSDTILCLLFFDFRIFFPILAKSYAYKVLSGQRQVKGKTWLFIEEHGKMESLCCTQMKKVGRLDPSYSHIFH